FNSENCDVVISETWQQKEYNILLEISKEVPTITIFRRGGFSYTPGILNKPKSIKLSDFGTVPVDELLWGIYSKENSVKEKPNVDIQIMPEDWQRAANDGTFISTLFRCGLIFEKDFLDSLIQKKPDSKFYFLFKKIAHRLYILLKFDKKPEPKKEEWWAETDEIPSEFSPCAEELIKKMKSTGHLINEERVFMASYLGCLRGVSSDSILKMFERHLLDYEPKISAFNTYQILGLFSENPYVVSDSYVRTHNMCKNCEETGKICTLQRDYLVWMEKSKAHRKSI
ncbi:hypothetical protein ACFLQI_03565, partial [Candidatus Undinarchaeota archaeon]